MAPHVIVTRLALPTALEIVGFPGSDPVTALKRRVAWRWPLYEAVIVAEAPAEAPPRTVIGTVALVAPGRIATEAGREMGAPTLGVSRTVAPNGGAGLSKEIVALSELLAVTGLAERASGRSVAARGMLSAGTTSK